MSLKQHALENVMSMQHPWTVTTEYHTVLHIGALLQETDNSMVIRAAESACLSFLLVSQ